MPIFPIPFEASLFKSFDGKILFRIRLVPYEKKSFFVLLFYLPTKILTFEVDSIETDVLHPILSCSFHFLLAYSQVLLFHFLSARPKSQYFHKLLNNASSISNSHSKIPTSTTSGIPHPCHISSQIISESES